MSRFVMIESKAGRRPWMAWERPTSGRAISLTLAAALVLAIAAAAAAPLLGAP